MPATELNRSIDRLVANQAAAGKRDGGSVSSLVAGRDALADLVDGRTPAAEPWLIKLPIVESRDRRTSGLRYAMTRIDSRGRLGDRSLVRVLAWERERGVEVSLFPEMVIMRPGLGGAVLVTRQGHLRLPPFVRRGLGLVGGEQLLLTACVRRGLLAAFTMSAVDAMTRAYAASGMSEVG